MRRMLVLIASTAIIASIPAIAAERTSNKDIDTTRTHSATVRNQPGDAAEKEKACRAYAASFYESVTLRQAAYADGKRTLALLDTVIDAFNELLAMKCSG
jgi:hypothetical protein